MTKQQADSLLPSKPTSSQVNPTRLVFALIADPKWGKSTFFMSNPNALLLAFEDGHKFIKGHKIIINEWKSKNHDIKTIDGVKHMTFMQAVEILEASDKFDMVVIDTADMAVKMCSDYGCAKRGVEHPQDGGDFGKGWELIINTPFRQAMMRLLKTGRGVAFITHSKTEIAKYSTGDKARKESTLAKGAKALVFTQADVIMHGEFGLRQQGQKQRDRILVTEGDMDTLAGNRAGTLLPARFIVDKKDPWGQFCRFFTDPKATEAAEKAYRVGMKGAK